jgi:hypothetical protein
MRKKNCTAISLSLVVTTRSSRKRRLSASKSNPPSA